MAPRRAVSCTSTPSAHCADAATPRSAGTGKACSVCHTTHAPTASHTSRTHARYGAANLHAARCVALSRRVDSSPLVSFVSRGRTLAATYSSRLANPAFSIPRLCGSHCSAQRSIGAANVTNRLKYCSPLCAALRCAALALALALALLQARVRNKDSLQVGIDAQCAVCSVLRYVRRSAMRCWSTKIRRNILPQSKACALHVAQRSIDRSLRNESHSSHRTIGFSAQ